MAAPSARVVDAAAPRRGDPRAIPTASATRTRLPPYLVLLVEDDPVTSMNAAEALRSAGLEVTATFAIDEAVATLGGEGDLRALVVDVELVGAAMDGFALARAVAARWPEVAILVVSGVREPTEDQLPAGARFLRKPYEAQELVGTVLALVAQRAAGLDEL